MGEWDHSPAIRLGTKHCCGIACLLVSFAKTKAATLARSRCFIPQGIGVVVGGVQGLAVLDWIGFLKVLELIVFEINFLGLVTVFHMNEWALPFVFSEPVDLFKVKELFVLHTIIKIHMVTIKILIEILVMATIFRGI